ncbi:MAG: sodium:proton exchanger [Polyangiaceae bacterium]|nr:sodium:proton exchanger [Polyangiaceae bacterium]
MTTATASKGLQVRLVQAAALIVVLGVLLIATQLAPEARSVVGTMAGLGVLLLAGTLTSELAEIVRLPHLSGYLAAGLICGPHVLRLIDLETIDRLQPVNSLTLALIALAGGAELRLDVLRKRSRSVAWATITQSTLVFAAEFAAFLALASFTPFVGMQRSQLFAVAVIWAVLAVSRSPAAILGIFAQLRPKGPLAEFSLAFVMFSNVVVILMMAIAIALVRPLLDVGAGMSFSDLETLLNELAGSTVLGVTLGIVLTVYLRLVGQNLLLVLLLLGLGLSELLRYIRLDAMLSFLVAGFVVENFSAQGRKLVKGIADTGAVVYVIFFALAGAHLELDLLRVFWPITVGMCAIRALSTYAAARASSWIAGDEPTLRRWGWSGLVSQAGLALGLVIVVSRAFPSIADAFRSMAIAVIAVNEIIGPIIFKIGLDAAGESRAGDDPEAPPSSVG